MKYYVRLGAATHEVTLEDGQVHLDGAPVRVDLARVPGTPLYHLLLGGDSWIVAAQELEEAGSWVLGVAGERFPVHVVEERARAFESWAGAAAVRSGAASVRAPMPGLVVRIEASEGQRVEAGAALVVVEAMKMENELRAPHGGLVRSVHVAVGQAVERGAVLVTLEG